MGMLGYFGWYGFYGNHGLGYLKQQQSQIELLNAQFAALQQRHVQFESRVALLRPESVDPDMLEELARSQLGLARSNDLIVRLAP
jgi:cell division protein FtsB